MTTNAPASGSATDNKRSSAPGSVFASDQYRFHGLFLGFLALIVWLPLPLGSNRAWAWHIMELWTFTLVALWLIGYIFHPYNPPRPLRRAAIALFLFVLWLAYVFSQTIPLPVETLQSLSPGAFELYFYEEGVTSGALQPLSIDRGATLEEFLKSSSYIGIFFLTLVLVNNRYRLRYLAVTILFVGLGESVYGLVNTLSGIEKIWWMEKYAYIGSVTGTFINRNHFAGHLEIVIPMALGLWLGGKEEFKHFNSVGARLKYIFSLALTAKGRMFAYIVVMFSAMFLSTSRGGNIALLVALFITIFIAFITRGKKARELKLAPAILFIAIIAGSWLGVHSLTERISVAEHQSKPRIEKWWQSKGIIEDYIVFGTGAGSFEYIIPLYEDRRLDGLYDHAHNDYIELLSDQGVIGFGLAFASISLVMFYIVSGYARCHEPFLRGILFASLGGSISLLLHAITDFNFYIPANAAYFYLVLAMGIVASTMKRRSKSGG